MGFLVRTSLFPAIAALVVLFVAGCLNLQMSRVYLPADEDWLTEGGNVERTNSRSTGPAPPLSLDWKYNAEAGFGEGAMLLLKDAVVVYTRQGDVQLVDVESGRRRGRKSFGDSVEGAPVFYRGLLIIPSVRGGASLAAFDLARGTTRWRVKGPGVMASPLLLGGRVIIVDAESHVQAFDAERGGALWETQLESSAVVLASPVAAGDGVLAVVDEQGHISILDAATGALKKEGEIGAPVASTPAFSDGVLFVATTRGRLVAVDAPAAERRWEAALAEGTVYLSPPAVGVGRVLVAGSDGSVQAVNLAGEVLWQFNTSEGFTAAPVVAGDVVYIGGLDKQLYALRASDGKVLWKQELGGRIKSGVSVGSGRVIVASEPHNVYSFSTQEVNNAATP